MLSETARNSIHLNKDMDFKHKANFCNNALVIHPISDCHEQEAADSA